jgi:hypothetical protein
MFKLEDSEGGVNLTGIFIGKVVQNQDPKGLMRVEVTIPGLTDSNVSIWCDYCSPVKSSSGPIPSVGDYLYVMFRNPSDPMSAIYLGYVQAM